MNCEETAALLQTAAKWQDGGRKTATAIVINTWNSAPRPIGSRLVVCEDGQFAGSISGGCVEKEVIVAAIECLRDNTCRMLTFGVADETAWQSGLSCGGGIEIFIAPFPSKDSPARLAFEQLNNSIVARQSGVLLTNTENGDVQFKSTSPLPTAGLHNTIFTEHCIPPPHLYIVGAVHITQALSPMVTACGFAVTIIDPRSAWNTTARFPDSKIKVCWPDEAFADLTLDSQTAIITLTHDPKIDDSALLAALRAPTGYIGALGSKRTHEKRRQRLIDNGVNEEALCRIHAPIGLNIGAKTAAEIAVSIAAQLIEFYSPS
ncbi:MAG: XdhC family protein [Gammaproteobacteria bacterium WSBS_2016_MAG_OTU1]